MNKTRMKDFIVGGMVGAILMVSSGALAANFQEVKAFVQDFNYLLNGSKVDIQQKALSKDGVTYLPTRAISEALGYEVSFDNKTQTISLNESKNAVSREDNTLQEVPSNEKGGEGAMIVEDLFFSYLDSNGKLDLEKVKQAVDSGKLDVNVQDKVTGQTLLMRSVIDDRYFVFVYLAGKGADPNIQDNEGRTALHHMTINHITTVGNELLDVLKADVFIEDNYGKKAIDYIEDRFDSMFIVLRSRML